MFKLPESLTIFNGEQVLSELKQYVDECIKGQTETVLLDAGELDDIDGAGLQILLAVCKTCTASHVSVQFTVLREPIRRLLKIAGVEAILNQSDGEEHGDG